MLRRIGLFSLLAFSNASSPHGYQSTGLWACWSRYGLVSWIKRLVCAVAIELTSFGSDYRHANTNRRESKRASRSIFAAAENSSTTEMLRRRDFVLVSEPQSACRRRDSSGLAESPRKTMGVGTLTRHAGSNRKRERRRRRHRQPRWPIAHRRGKQNTGS